jgi:hypothetical protein
LCATTPEIPRQPWLRTTTRTKTCKNQEVVPYYYYYYI